jgi:Chaperone of endosialidase
MTREEEIAQLASAYSNALKNGDYAAQEKAAWALYNKKAEAVTVNGQPAGGRATYTDADGRLRTGGSGVGIGRPDVGISERAQALEDPGSSVSRDFEYGRDKEQAGRDVMRAQHMQRDMLARGAQRVDYSQAGLAAQLAQQARGQGIEARGSQQDALTMYRAAAMGQGPSAAQAQFAQALDQSRAQQASMAASARGSGLARAAAQTQAMQNASGIGQSAANASAALRAQEQQQGMAGFAGLGTTIRSGDMQNRGLDQQSQGQFAQQSQFQSQMNEAQQARNDQASQFYRGQEGNVRAAQQQAGQARQAAQENTMNANLGLQARRDAAKRADDEADRNRAAAYIGAAGAIVATAATGGAAAPALVAAGANVAAQEAAASSSSGLTTKKPDAYASSDRRTKTDIAPAGRKVDEFLNALSAQDYRYRDPAAHGAGEGRHAGVMAQDLERSELGRRLVSDTPAGKMVDYGPRGMATMLASMASMHKKIGSLESALAAKHGARR